MADIDIGRAGPAPATGAPFLIGLAALTIAQAAVFHDHFATPLTVLVAGGLGIGMRHWTAGLWAAASFLVAFGLSAAVGHMGYFRPIADPLLGAAMAFTAGAIAGGVFDILRNETAPDRPARTGIHQVGA